MVRNEEEEKEGEKEGGFRTKTLFNQPFEMIINYRAREEKKTMLLIERNMNNGKI
jgi:hypothetical protein